jgi:hypothetical protein
MISAWYSNVILTTLGEVWFKCMSISTVHTLSNYEVWVIVKCGIKDITMGFARVMAAAIFSDPIYHVNIIPLAPINRRRGVSRYQI